MIFARLSHFFVSWCCIQTCAPKGKVIIYWACTFLFAIFCTCVLPLGRLSILIGVGFAEVGELLSELGAAVRSDGFGPAERVKKFGELGCDFCHVCAGQVC